MSSPFPRIADPVLISRSYDRAGSLLQQTTMFQSVLQCRQFQSLPLGCCYYAYPVKLCFRYFLGFSASVFSETVKFLRRAVTCKSGLEEDICAETVAADGNCQISSI
jgi:hypothetical protein